MKTVLIVDDSATIRQMAGFTLKSAGYEVLEAADGEDAFKKLNTGRIDLLMTDLYMPKMDGIELTRQFRSVARYRFTPVLILTTEAQTAKKAEGQAAGVTGWFVKPFVPTQLVTVIKRLLP